MQLKRKVEHLLQNQPELRDSDKALMAKVWEDEGFVMSEEQYRRFMNTTTPESITRVRRSLRSKYPASPEIEQRRYDLFKRNRDNYSPTVASAEFMKQYGGYYDE